MGKPEEGPGMRRKYSRDAYSLCIIGIFFNENIVLSYLGITKKETHTHTHTHTQTKEVFGLFFFSSLNQTWVCTPACNEASILTLGLVKERAGFIADANQRSETTIAQKT